MKALLNALSELSAIYGMSELERAWKVFSRGSAPRQKQRKPMNMNRIGPVAKRRLALVAELTGQAVREGWFARCEVGTILVERGLTDQPCMGEKTFAHSMKAHKRGRDPVLDREVIRACTFHHYSVLDLLNPALTLEIVREAIRRRG